MINALISMFITYLWFRVIVVICLHTSCRICKIPYIPFMIPLIHFLLLSFIIQLIQYKDKVLTSLSIWSHIQWRKMDLPKIITPLTLCNLSINWLIWSLKWLSFLSPNFSFCSFWKCTVTYGHNCMFHNNIAGQLQGISQHQNWSVDAILWMLSYLRVR